MSVEQIRKNTTQLLIPVRLKYRGTLIGSRGVTRYSYFQQDKSNE